MCYLPSFLLVATMTSLLTLVSEISDKQSAVRFLQSKCILHYSYHNMTLSLGEKVDRWRCNARACHCQCNLRKGIWLENSKILLDTFIFFVFFWSKEYTSLSFYATEFNFSNHTIVDWKNFLREVCADTTSSRHVLPAHDCKSLGKFRRSLNQFAYSKS